MRVRYYSSYPPRIREVLWEMCPSVKLANNLLRDLPLKLRNAFEDMTPENTPPTIFDFIFSL